MSLKREQCEKLLRELGIWVTGACDKCGQLLGSVRWRDRVSVGNGCQVRRQDSREVPSNVTITPENVYLISKANQFLSDIRSL